MTSNTALARFNAWFFDTLDTYINHGSRRHKEAAFGDLDGAITVELGAGTGANVAYLTPGTRLIAVEPNIHMHPRLNRNCASVGIDVTILSCGAEDTGIADSSIDEVICSLVLCSVDDPAAVLAEVRRILRPGGRFRYVEHVGAAGLRGHVQRCLRKPWGRLFEGCDPSRHTDAVIERAGFTDVRTERLKFRHSLFWPVNTAIWGIAVR